MSWNFYPEDRFSSYDDYVKYLKERGFALEAPNKIYVEVCEDGIFAFPEPPFKESVEYIRKDLVIDAIKLAYGKVSMNPFDCSEAFEELLNKVGHEIHRRR